MTAIQRRSALPQADLGHANDTPRALASALRCHSRPARDTSRARPWLRFIDSVGPFSFPHSFERLDDGHILATFQHSAARPDEAGGLVELDRAGGLVKASSAVNAIDPELHPYSLAPLPEIDRGVELTVPLDPSRV